MSIRFQLFDLYTSVNQDMNYVYVITLIWFSSTLGAKHYLIETKDNVSHTETDPSPIGDNRRHPSRYKYLYDRYLGASLSFLVSAVCSMNSLISQMNTSRRDPRGFGLGGLVYSNGLAEALQDTKTTVIPLTTSVAGKTVWMLDGEKVNLTLQDLAPLSSKHDTAQASIFSSA